MNSRNSWARVGRKCSRSRAGPQDDRERRNVCTCTHGSSGKRARRTAHSWPEDMHSVMIREPPSFPLTWARTCAPCDRTLARTTTFGHAAQEPHADIAALLRMDKEQRPAQRRLSAARGGLPVRQIHSRPNGHGYRHRKLARCGPRCSNESPGRQVQEGTYTAA